MQIKLIAISGPDGAGKTHLANSIRRIASDQFDHTIVLEFAEALRRELALVLRSETDAEQGHNPRTLWEKPTPPWARQLMRGWGDWRRSQASDYWVNLWRDEFQACIESLSEHGDSLLVLNSDLRYFNELTMVHSLGGQCVYLDDASVPEHQLGHQLLDVRAAADVGFTTNSKAKMWADPEAVLEAIGCPV